jgi:hypothetical protein
VRRRTWHFQPCFQEGCNRTHEHPIKGHERYGHRRKPLILFWFMAGTTGLEPATSAVTGQRSNQLSYVPELR